MELTSKPKIKPTIQFHRLNDRVYFKSAGQAAEMEDPSGFVGSLCELLDGKRDIAAVTALLSQTYSQDVIQYLPEALNALDEAHFLEDDQTNNATGLTEADLKRWSRNIEFFGAYSKAHENKYAAQLRLKTVKVALFGLGGLGSHILYDLAALGVQNIKAVDFDRIELSNLNRQILYSERDIGRLKTEAAKERIYQFMKNANIEFINKRISSSQDIEEIIRDREIVICVADKPKKDMLGWLNEACVRQKIPFINGGVDVKRAMYCVVIPQQTGCVECWKSGVQQNDPLSHELLLREPDAEAPDTPDPAVVNFVSTLTGLILTEFIKLTTRIAQPQALGKLLAFDFDTVRIEEVERWEKNPTCAICSTQMENA